jgi:hypothetical protein
MIPPLYALYDAEAYLDWERTVDNKFSSHVVPEQYRVRHATSEFKDFAIIWWNELSSLSLHPDTWDRLKAVMSERFVLPAYQHDLRKNLQHLDQGDMSVQDYYAELQKGMIRAGVHEEKRIKFGIFILGCILKFRTLLTIRNTILSIICSSLLCWLKKNCRVFNR